MAKKAWYSRWALKLALILPLFMGGAALGTKNGYWGWEFGLITLFVTAGLALTAITALLAFVSLIAILRAKPREGWLRALIVFAVPLGFLALFAQAAQKAEANPIHDVSTDVQSPPQFSARTLLKRQSARANPLNDYRIALGELESWAQAEEPLRSASHQQLITELYPNLAPVTYSEQDEERVATIVTLAMREVGLTAIKGQRIEGSTGLRIEGVAQTFWFGFKDDVVARIANGRIDFRSVSRVGQSDLGVNAARVAKLRAKVDANLNR